MATSQRTAACVIGEITTDAWCTRENILNLPCQSKIQGVTIYVLRANVLNFEEKITTLEKTVSNWKRRKLTLMGKINIVKTLGSSKLIYSAFLLSIPKGLVEKN